MSRLHRDPVEEIQLRDLQDMVNGPELGARRGDHGGPDRQRLVGDRVPFWHGASFFSFIRCRRVRLTGALGVPRSLNVMAPSLIALALAITTLAVMVRVWKSLWGKTRAEPRVRPPDRSLLRRWGLSGL